MQIFHCPFCGDRDETEFRFITEAGKQRPEPSSEASDEAWTRYLFLNKSPQGFSREVWCHLPCLEYFILERDTNTKEVIRSIPLSEECHSSIQPE